MMPPAYEAFRQELASIIDDRFYSIEWLDYQVANGAIRVLGNDKAVILFKFHKYPTGWTELQGEVAAGDLATIRDDLIPAAETIARGMGCGSTQIESRMGWVKVLPDYEVHQTTIKKVL